MKFFGIYKREWEEGKLFDKSNCLEHNKWAWNKKDNEMMGSIQEEEGSNQPMTCQKENSQEDKRYRLKTA
jgi:hypothetical protein